MLTAVVLSLVLLSQPQPPTTPAPASTDQKQQQSKPQRQDANEAPAKVLPLAATTVQTPPAVPVSTGAQTQPALLASAAVQNPPAPPVAGQVDNNAGKQAGQTALDWWLVFASAMANVVIALVTIALAFVAIRQAVYMRDALTETRNATAASTAATETAVRALNMANRPRLVVRPITVDGIDDRGNLYGPLTNGTAWVTNVGVLPATLQFFYAQWLHGPHLPFGNPARTAIDESTATAVVQPGQFGRQRLPDFEIPFALYSELSNVADLARSGRRVEPALNLYLVGYIKYVDSIGLRRTFFAFKYDTGLRDFVTVEHPSYSYEE